MRILNRFLLALSAATLATMALAEITITCSVKEGQKISGLQAFRITLQSSHTVTEVEFYVNDDLRSTDESTPYEFDIDTIAEKEGPIKVKILAYDSEGNQKVQTLNLVVDNELAKGANYFVEQGLELLSEGKWLAAIEKGRVAMKATPKHLGARVLLARANFGRGVYDAAQKFIEDILAEDPKNADALDLRAAISLRTAFNATGTSREDTVGIIGRALKQAAQSRASIYEARLDNFGAVNDENRLRFVDLAIRAGRYSLVYRELDPLFRSNPRNSSVANRLIYAQLRGGKFRQAIDNASIYGKRGLPDAAGWALIAIARQRSGDADGSITAETEAIKNDSSDVTVRSAQAFLALARGRAQAFGGFVNDLAKDEDQRFEVMIYRSVLLNSANDFEGTRNFFQQAVLNEPTSYDAYIVRANQLIGYSTNQTGSKEDAAYYRSLARVMFEAAIAAKPESFEALTGLAICDLIEGKPALAHAQSAVQAGVEYGAGHYVLSMVQGMESQRLRQASSVSEGRAAGFRANGQLEEARKAEDDSKKFAAEADKLQAQSEASIKLAGQCDVVNLQGKGIPNLYEAWRYFASYGKPVLVIQPQ
ncbi:MAG: tetratricopeptide repeat protein [Chthonomonas sp.]|nr:tetratricopeptide repeat protein [Chthonomonas sp.]